MTRLADREICVTPDKDRPPAVGMGWDALEDPPTTPAQLAYRQLETMIVTGILPPGQMLSEIELSEKLGISRFPIRDALQLLARDNLVQVVPRRGTFVRFAGPDEQLLLLEMRRPLEIRLVSRAARFAADDQLAAIGDIARKFAIATRTGIIPALQPLMRGYYAILYASARQPYLAEALSRVISASWRFGFLYGDEADHERLSGHRQAVFSRTLARDASGAVEATNHLIDDLEAIAHRHLSSSPPHSG